MLLVEVHVVVIDHDRVWNLTSAKSLLYLYCILSSLLHHTRNGHTGAIFAFHSRQAARSSRMVRSPTYIPRLCFINSESSPPPLACDSARCVFVACAADTQPSCLHLPTRMLWSLLSYICELSIKLTPPFVVPAWTWFTYCFFLICEWLFGSCPWTWIQRTAAYYYALASFGKLLIPRFLTDPSTGHSHSIHIRVIYISADADLRISWI